MYSALLLECELPGRWLEKRTAYREKWIEFINQYGLRGDAEFTDGAIKRSAIFDGIDDAVGLWVRSQ